jgi:hypothetical protein
MVTKILTSLGCRASEGVRSINVFTLTLVEDVGCVRPAHAVEIFGLLTCNSTTCSKSLFPDTPWTLTAGCGDPRRSIPRLLLAAVVKKADETMGDGTLDQWGASATW